MIKVFRVWDVNGDRVIREFRTKGEAVEYAKNNYPRLYSRIHVAVAEYRYESEEDMYMRRHKDIRHHWDNYS